MSKASSSQQSHLRIIGLSIIAISILVVTLGVAARNKRFTPSSSAIRPEPKPTAERVEAEVVTLGPDGFEPSQITRPAGRFLLAVDNRAELEKVRLHLNPVITDATANGEPSGFQVQEPSLFDIAILKENRNLDQLVDLSPGKYVLTETTHPDWVCHITITAQ